METCPVFSAGRLDAIDAIERSARPTSFTNLTIQLTRRLCQIPFAPRLFSAPHLPTRLRPKDRGFCPSVLRRGRATPPPSLLTWPRHGSHEVVCLIVFSAPCFAPWRGASRNTQIVSLCGAPLPRAAAPKQLSLLRCQTFKSQRRGL